LRDVNCWHAHGFVSAGVTPAQVAANAGMLYFASLMTLT